VPSLVAMIGMTIRRHFIEIGLMEEKMEVSSFLSSDPNSEIKGVLERVEPIRESTQLSQGEICPDCEAANLVFQEGCKKCTSCGYENCG